MKKRLTMRIAFSFLLLSLFGCAGVNTFHEYAREGDTIAVAIGWAKNYTKDNVTVYFRPQGAPIAVTYLPGDPRVRAAVNLYPDPLSSLIVSREVEQNWTVDAQTYSDFISGSFTDDDKDWWQTTFFIDIPPGLPTGRVHVGIENPDGDYRDSHFELLPGSGTPNKFYAEGAAELAPHQLRSLGRVSHYTVSIDGPGIPYGLSVNLTHDADSSQGGTGTPFVINPVGYLKNVSWNDDGTNLKTILLPANSGIITNLVDFKFYVAGGLTNLASASLEAYDADGNALSGYSVNIVKY